MSIQAAREHLGKAAFALDAPFPDELTAEQMATLAYAGACHQQAALVAMLDSLTVAWLSIDELRAEHESAEPDPDD